jgi:hypothetical protein
LNVLKKNNQPIKLILIFVIMKKLLLLLALSFISCDVDEEIITPPQNDCNCFEETIWLNNGIDTIMIERKLVPSYKCELWGYGNEYLPIPRSEYFNRFKCY